MKTLVRVLSVLLLSSVFLFTCFGYAAITDQLKIVGNVNAIPPDGLVILKVDSLSEGAVSNYFQNTVHSSTVELGSSASSSASFAITVFNNTGYSYYYDKMVYSDDAYDNKNIVATVSGIAAKQELKNGETVTFTVKFTYKNTSNISNKILNSVINYQFVPNKNDAGNIAVENVLEKFQMILNDSAIGGDFETLINNMDQSSRRANETYIGNVVGADSADTEAINDLFTDEIMNYLILQIGDGEAKKVTAIIKREPLDGNNNSGTNIYNSNGSVKTAGCEMTIYLTPDDIPADRLWFGSGGSSITVYAAVFTTDAVGNWYQLSPLYEGTATTNNYDGNSLISTANSFNTDTWRSKSKVYTTPNGEVTVQQGQDIDTLISSKLY